MAFESKDIYNERKIFNSVEYCAGVFKAFIRRKSALKKMEKDHHSGLIIFETSNAG